MTRAIRTHPPTDYVTNDLLDRFDHFYTENNRIIPAALKALSMENLEAFGRSVDQSQRSAERLLKNQVPETIFLARTARELGAQAASAFGAGFGGSVWALVASEKADSFIEVWESQYRSAFPNSGQNAYFFKTAAGPAAFQLRG
jgi:galactokinase